ncbi:hypothetical protein [Cryptosporangium sp. NPDC048952]|uniref:hypothetical protein n=1 Tax=Cryptosporangium sp. NPDC048952 TaxID=3363961 RepID=UPI0037207A09
MQSETHDTSELATYAADPLLSQAVKGIKDIAEYGVVYRGKSTWTAHVTSLRLDAKPPTAALDVCLDVTQSNPVRISTGESVKAPGQLAKYRLAAEVRLIDGQWLVIKNDPLRKTAC